MRENPFFVRLLVSPYDICIEGVAPVASLAFALKEISYPFEDHCAYMVSVAPSSLVRFSTSSPSAYAVPLSLSPSRHPT